MNLLWNFYCSIAMMIFPFYYVLLDSLGTWRAGYWSDSRSAQLTTRMPWRKCDEDSLAFPVRAS